MATYNFNNPFIIDKNESAVEIQNESITVVNGKATLKQIPDKFMKVQVFEPATYGSYLQNTYQENITLTADTPTIDVSTVISAYTNGDGLIVAENTVVLSCGINYTIDNTIITNLEGVWSAGTNLNFIVIKATPDLVTAEKFWVEIKDGIPNENQYLVDYRIGELKFHPSVIDGTKLYVNYFGWGFIQIPVERIYYKQDNDVIQNLEELIANSQTGIEALATIGDTVNRINNIKLVEITNKVILSTDNKTVNIGIADFNVNKDVLIVAKNTTLLTKGIDYILSGTGSTATITEINNNNWSGETEFDFIIHRISY